MPPKKAIRKPHAWSLYPDLHTNVAQLLEEADLHHFAFYEVDDPATSIRDYDTNIMGRFRCHNKTCSANGWGSKVVAITIRMYSEDRYNARVYFQRCKLCNHSSKPILDNNSYAERVAYRIKKWNNVEVVTPWYRFPEDDRDPHQSRLCEGCKAGHCRFGAD